jgi:hypothetical protein
MRIRLEPNDYTQFYKMLRGYEYLSNSSSDASCDDSDERSGVSSQKHQYKFKKNDDKKSISSCNLVET